MGFKELMSTVKRIITLQNNQQGEIYNLIDSAEILLLFPNFYVRLCYGLKTWCRLRETYTLCKHFISKLQVKYVSSRYKLHTRLLFLWLNISGRNNAVSWIKRSNAHSKSFTNEQNELPTGSLRVTSLLTSRIIIVLIVS